MKAFLDGFINLVPDPTVVVDEDGLVMASNQQMKDLLGWGEEDLLDQPIEKLIPQRFHENHRAYLRRYLQGPSTRPMNAGGPLFVLSKDGREIPASISLHPVDFQGQTLVAAAIRDITIRIEAEEKMRHTADRLARLLDATPVGAVMLELENDDFYLVGANRAGADFLALAPEAYNRQPARQIFPGDCPEAARQQLRNCARTGRTETISQMPYQDQRLSGIYDLTATQIAPGRVSLFFQDVTELVRSYETTLEGWSRAMDLRDKDTAGHTIRVSQLAVLLGEEMGLDGNDLMYLRWGALLHDIGKMGIPDEILFKPGALDEGEWDVMRRHPDYAREMLQPISFLGPALEVPYAHHEKWDGSGYPRGLTDGEIPISARIFSVVDVWDALRSDRPYRKAWPEKKTRDYLVEKSGSHFQPEIVQAFLRLLDRSPSLAPA